MNNFNEYTSLLVSFGKIINLKQIKGEGHDKGNKIWIVFNYFIHLGIS